MQDSGQSENFFLFSLHLFFPQALPSWRLLLLTGEIMILCFWQTGLEDALEQISKSRAGRRLMGKGQMEKGLVFKCGRTAQSLLLNRNTEFQWGSQQEHDDSWPGNQAQRKGSGGTQPGRARALHLQASAREDFAVKNAYSLMSLTPSYLTFRKGKRFLQHDRLRKWSSQPDLIWLWTKKGLWHSLDASIMQQIHCHYMPSPAALGFQPDATRRKHF